MSSRSRLHVDDAGLPSGWVPALLSRSLKWTMTNPHNRIFFFKVCTHWVIFFFCRAAIIKYHKLDGLDHQKFIVSMVLEDQFSSVTQLCQTFCNPMDYSMPGFPVHNQLLEPTQTHIHRISDAVQPSCPLSSPFPPAFSLSQRQGLFQ